MIAPADRDNISAGSGPEVVNNKIFITAVNTRRARNPFKTRFFGHVALNRLDGPGTIVRK